VYVDLVDPEVPLYLQPGDKLFFQVSTWTLAGLTDPSGVGIKGIADLAADELEADYLRHGVATIVTVRRARLTGVATAEFKFEVIVIGFQDPEQRALAGASPYAWGLLVLGFVFAGVVYEVNSSFEGSPEAFGEAVDAASVFPVALAIIAGFALLYFLGRK
jgi:hypothetical protein